ncbi:UNVERIFIED_CONTAM: hypothetical protein FKN15_049453 [Acipenser sinensis]
MCFPFRVNPDKLTNVQQKLEAFLAQEQALKERAQRCFVSYLRSVYLMKNKDVFDVFKMQLSEYACSLGLAVAPRVRFIQKAKKQREERARDKTDTTREASSGEEQESGTEDELKNFKARLRGQKPTSVGATSRGQGETSRLAGDISSGGGSAEESGSSGEEEEDETGGGTSGMKFVEDDDDDDDDLKDLDLLTVKRRDVFGLDAASEEIEIKERQLFQLVFRKRTPLIGQDKIIQRVAALSISCMCYCIMYLKANVFKLGRQSAVDDQNKSKSISPGGIALWIA